MSGSIVSENAYHPPASFKFPSKDSRSCRSEWFKTWPWLHYDTSTNSARCFICMSANAINLMPQQHRKELAFVSDGFKNWKKATWKFQAHEKSESHRYAGEKLENTKKTPISAIMSKKVAAEQEKARMFLTVIFSSIKYLCCQDFPLRGHAHNDGPLYNLVVERVRLIPQLEIWLMKRDTWLSDTIQNEIIEQMAHAVQRQILEEVKDSEFVGVVADGTTDITGDEQFSVCIQHSSKSFKVENCFLGMYNSPDSTGETLATVLKDVLQRFNVPLSKLQGFSFDGASNMSGKHSGVQSIIKRDCPGALYVHCCNHSLDLVLQEVARQVRGIIDALQFVNNSTKLIRQSSKRKDIFVNMFDDTEKVVTLSSLCPTRWCVRANAIEKIIQTYPHILLTFRELKSDRNCRGEVQATASGLLKQGMECRTYFFLLAAHSLFLECEVIAKTLQGVKVIAQGGKASAFFKKLLNDYALMKNLRIFCTQLN